MKEYKGAVAGETNDAIAKHVENTKAEIEEIEGKLKPFKESGAKLITLEELNATSAICKKS